MEKVLALDLDGTLFYPKRRVKMISARTLKFVRSFADAGGHLVIASGRNRLFGEKVVDRIGRNVDVIGCNAAFVTIGGKTVFEKTLESAPLLKVLDEIERKYHPMLVSLMSRAHNLVYRYPFKNAFHKFIYKAWNFCQGVYREPYVVSREIFEEDLRQGLAYKVMILFGITPWSKKKAREANKALRERYGDVVEASWSAQTVELSPVGCSKASGLQLYLDKLGLDEEGVYVVGDSGNDISMFNAFPRHSFHMSHAPEAVAKYARFRIRRVSDLDKYVFAEEGTP